jgi:hypothetical protein
LAKPRLVEILETEPHTISRDTLKDLEVSFLNQKLVADFDLAEEEALEIVKGVMKDCFRRLKEKGEANAGGTRGTKTC